MFKRHWSLKKTSQFFHADASLRRYFKLYMDLRRTLHCQKYDLYAMWKPAIKKICFLKVARYSFSRPIPPMFVHKLRRHKQSFGKIATTVVLDKDESLLWWGLQWHRSCHSNEMTLLPILLTEVFLGTGNCSSKIIHGSFFLQ